MLWWDCRRKPMKLFLDTAHLEHIEEIASFGVLDGVTTNPTLLFKEGKVDFKKHVQKICKVVSGPVNVEVLDTDWKGMVKEAHDYAAWAENIVVKVPMTSEGLKAVRALRHEGIPTNVTLVFSANQALLAAKAGATYLSPFIGRLDDIGEEGMEVVHEIKGIFANYDFETQILVASVRHPRHVTEAALVGADITSMPYEIFLKLLKHPLTDIGLTRFLQDWKKRKT